MQAQLSSSSLSLNLHRPFLGFGSKSSPSLAPPPLVSFPNPSKFSCNLSFSSDSSRLRAKRNDNIWSIDNEIAAKEKGSSSDRAGRRRKRRGRGVRVSNGKKKSNNKKGSTSSGLVMVSSAMLMEIETVLQTQEPVIKPSWTTFASSVSGIWKGIGAVFSPITAELEPIGIGNQNENLFDCYTLSCIDRPPSEGLCSQVRRKTNWVALNPIGEQLNHLPGSFNDPDKHRSDSKKDTYDVNNSELNLPSYESFNFGKSEVLEEDTMSMEPGLVFFEDGSYSRGPIEIPVGEHENSKYFLSPAFKFEQCLVKGCHKRLRIVHTIEFSEGGSDIQIMRVAVYEEQWVSPVDLYEEDSDQVELKPISQRRRTQPSELAGSWKVFEVSATPIFDEEEKMEEGAGPPYVYLCTETLKKRSLPESSSYFGEEEMLDMNDVTVLWLPGGVTGYVDVGKDGILCIGVGWYSEEGLNLVMERDYGMDGKLKEVRWKSEVKRRWTDSVTS